LQQPLFRGIKQALRLALMQALTINGRTYEQIGDSQHRLSTTMQPINIGKTLVVHLQGCRRNRTHVVLWQAGYYMPSSEMET